MKKGFLVDKEMLESLSVLDEESAKKLIDLLNNLKIKERVITKTLFYKNIEKIREISGEDKKIIEKFFIKLGYSHEEISKPKEDKKIEEEDGKVKVLSSPAFIPKKIEVQDFVKYFRSRYEKIKKILQGRNLENLTSLRKIGNSKGNYSVIVGILDKKITKNKNLIFEVEDMTGTARILVSKNKKDLFKKAKNVLVDEVVAFSVSGNSDWLFANDVIFPDCALPEKRRGKKDEIVAFISDIHAGSSMFLEENFLRFIKWLNGVEGDEKHRELARKVKYVFINGDLVDGIGHFPEQEKFLDIKDIKGQYEKVTSLLKLIRKDIKIIIGPGNHDAVWLGEPQPIISEKWAPELHKMENVVLVPNPALVEIDDGFKILMYHGFSLHGVIEEIPEIRLKYGHNSPTRVVKELLRARHLSPMHGFSDYIPCEEDELVISQVPDIITTADIHRSEVSTYNNILLIATSCWQSITPFQEKVGNHPDFCKVPLFNLKTREVKILDFFGEPENEIKENNLELKNKTIKNENRN